MLFYNIFYIYFVIFTNGQREEGVFLTNCYLLLTYEEV